MEERARELGIPTIPMTVDRLHDRQDMPALRRFLRENKVDVLHAHWSLDMIVPPVAALLERVPVRVLSRHLPNTLRSRSGGWIYSNILFSRVVTVSELVRRTLIGSGMKSGPRGDHPPRHGHPGVRAHDPDAAGEPPPDGHPGGRLAVGIVGRVASEKGHKYLFQAAKILGDRYPLRCVVIGDGPDDAKLKLLVQEMGIADKVIFAGFRDDVNNAINALDIVALPSTWEEPCSAAVQQGMALHKPVIGTRSGGRRK